MSTKYSIIVDKAVPMEMRDGTLLKGDIYRLEDGQKYPAILMRCPYDRNTMADSSYLKLLDAVRAGYIIVTQNVRGTFDSEGKYDSGDNYGTVEGHDGYDSVEWIASQPWCNGNIGTCGASYLGFLQWQLGKENPPHLKAMAPWSCGTTSMGETTLQYGVIELGVMARWIAMMGLEIANKLEKSGKDVSKMRQMLGQASANPAEVYNYLPLKKVPHFDFDGVREMWQNRALHPIPGPEYLEKGCYAYSKISVPCFHVSGWYDFFTWGTFQSFNQMQQHGASEKARNGQHILLGPWGHLGPISPMGAFGDIDFGIFAGTRGSQLSEYSIRFFNKYLKGDETKYPIIRYFVMGKNMWQEADTWPLPQTKWQRFHFHSKGHANTCSGDGLLSRDEPGSENPDTYIYNPLFPIPTTGHRGHEANGFVVSPLDQSRIEHRDDMLCYPTSELTDDIEVTGPLELHLFASSSARDTDFTARLCDVYPDGRSFTIASGIIRAQYRKSFFTPELLNPGDINEFIINMGHTSQLFRTGHRIRIDITSSNFPEFDRNMNTGNPIGEDNHGIPAMQTIYHHSQYKSYIDLPVI